MQRPPQFSVPGWDEPEKSCGALAQTLPDGKSLWDLCGTVGERLRPLLRNIGTLTEGMEFEADSFVIAAYMAGEKPVSSAPWILLFSSSKKTRQRLRKLVRDRGMLEGYPPVKLGEAMPFTPLRKLEGPKSENETSSHYEGPTTASFGSQFPQRSPPDEPHQHVRSPTDITPLDTDAATAFTTISIPNLSNASTSFPPDSRLSRIETLISSSELGLSNYDPDRQASSGSQTPGELSCRPV